MDDAESLSLFQQASYAIGYEWALHHGERFRDLDMAQVAAGMQDAVRKDARPILDEAARQAAIEAFDRRHQEMRSAAAQARAQEARHRSEAVLSDNRTRSGVRETPSGLQYEILTEGTGTSPRESDVVRVHYRGTLADGTAFDSSHARGGPVELPLRYVIRGWREGLTMMREGARWRMWIPADLAHGDEGSGQQIPGGELLIYEVELLGIIPSTKQETP